MSRLESQKKAGYYPTPPAVVERIAGHLTPPGRQNYRWLDPCCGAGVALHELRRMRGGTSYGIELDQERAAKAAEIVDHVLAGDYEAMRLPKTNAGLSALFLNPPYDADDEAGGRLELSFLRGTQDWLIPGGVLIYIIPKHRISGYVANRLAAHFRDVRIYRFPDPYFEDFRQVVIFAVKRAQPQRDDRLALRIAQARTAALPILPYGTRDRYRIPPAPDTPFYFRPAEADPEGVLAEAYEVGVWNTKAWTDHFRTDDEAAIQPLMPLRRGHIAMVLAAGLLDNMIIEKDEQTLLVKGRLHKVQDDVSTEQDRESELRRTRERFLASITTLDLETGELDLIAGNRQLRSWMLDWQDQLAAKIIDTFQPLHRMDYDGLDELLAITKHHSKHRHLPGRATTGLFEAQRQVVAALTRHFLADKSYAFLQATMGTGKTTIATSLADVLKKYLKPDEPFPVVVVCPPHLVEKWPREIAQIVPLARGHVIRRVSDFKTYLRKVHTLDPRTLQIAVVPTTMLKLGSGWTPAVVRQRGRHKRLVEVLRNGEIVSEVQRQDTFACPRCGGTLYHRDEVGNPDYPMTDESYFEGRRLTCDNPVRKWVGDPDGCSGHWETAPCGEPLYQAWRGHWPEPERDGFGQLLPLPEPRYPIAKYIKKKHADLFELAIVDEIHEMKARSSDRGHAFGVLASASKRTLGMTGTLFGGMATSLFYLLHRLDHRIRHEFSWRDGHRFAALYGVLERVTRRRADQRDHDEYGHYTGLRRDRTRTVERPGISPALVTRLLDTTIFLTLEDLGFDLPSYTETPVTIAMPNGGSPSRRTLDMAGTYRRLECRLRDAAREDWSLMGEYLQTTLCWPNAPWRDEESTVGTFHGLPRDRVYPKEGWLVETCRAELEQGRRVLVYLRQTGTRDIQPRLRRILAEAGLHVTTLRSSVSTTRREAWLKRRVQGGLDVLLANPRLVSTGLDLIDFPTLVFYEPEYSIYLIQQASRRSWRLGQTRPVKVYFAVYEDTMEHRAMAHVGRKIAAAQLLYGDDVAGALVDQAGAGGNLLEELAREVTSNADVPDLGEMFVQEHQKVEGAGWLLGSGAVDLTDREATESRSNGRQQQSRRPEPDEGVDPSQVNQLRMF